MLPSACSRMCKKYSKALFATLHWDHGVEGRHVLATLQSFMHAYSALLLWNNHLDSLPFARTISVRCDMDVAIPFPFTVESA